MTRDVDRRDLLQRSRERARRRRLRFWFGITVGVLLILAGIGYLVHAPYFRITRLVITPTRFLDRTAVEAVVQQEFRVAARPWWPSTQAFWYPQRAIALALARSFPALDRVRVDREGIHTLRLRLDERVPAALWCAAGRCSYVDRGGVVFAPTTLAPEHSGFVAWSGNVLVTRYGQRLLPAEHFAAVRDTLAGLPSVLGLTAVAAAPAQVNIQGEFSIIVTMVTPSGASWTLMLDPRNAPADTLGNLAAAFTSKAFADEATGAVLDHVDARFRNKVFYKFR